MRHIFRNAASLDVSHHPSHLGFTSAMITHQWLVADGWITEYCSGADVTRRSVQQLCPGIGFGTCQPYFARASVIHEALTVSIQYLKREQLHVLGFYNLTTPRTIHSHMQNTFQHSDTQTLYLSLECVNIASGFITVATTTRH